MASFTSAAGDSGGGGRGQGQCGGTMMYMIKELYQWIQCCNLSDGKWRMLLRSMYAPSVIDKYKDGGWYCIVNTWDEKAASCGATQENLPAVEYPLWVVVDNYVET
mmetsp:Transcript_1831/g.2850  ORF Transcript_1831/g.2850 Transcript_1831/m.2850 type:complete len:106 (-) Transcript_1831:162-479(-)